MESPRSKLAMSSPPRFRWQSTDLTSARRWQQPFKLAEVLVHHQHQELVGWHFATLGSITHGLAMALKSSNFMIIITSPTFCLASVLVSFFFLSLPPRSLLFWFRPSAFFRSQMLGTKTLTKRLPFQPKRISRGFDSHPRGFLPREWTSETLRVLHDHYAEG